MLWFVTQDEEQVDRLFRKSALMREKWDKKLTNITYGLHTIRKASRYATDVYRSKRSKPKEAIDKFQEIYDSIFQIQWRKYSHPLCVLAILDNAQKTNWGYDHEGILTFASTIDIQNLQNLSNGCISNCTRSLSFSLKYPYRVVAKGGVTGATRYQLLYREHINPETLDSTLKVGGAKNEQSTRHTPPCLDTLFKNSTISDLIGWQPLPDKAKWTLALVLKCGPLHVNELLYRVESVGKKKTMSKRNFRKTLRLLEGKDNKDLKPYFKIDGEGYVNLVSNITEVLEENEMTEEKKRTIAENQRQREDFEVRKAKVLEDLHHEVEVYVTQESTVNEVKAAS